MRLITILTMALLILVSPADAKTIDDKVPTQDNWEKFFPKVCPMANSYKRHPVIFEKDYEIHSREVGIFQEGYVIKPKKINPDGSTTKAYLKNISLGELSVREKKTPLPQRIAFLNENGDLVTENGELVSKSNPIKRYQLASKMLNFVGNGEELMEKDERKAPEPRSYEDEKFLLNSSTNCSYLQTSPQIFTTSSRWRKFNARYSCGGSILEGFELGVDTYIYTKSLQTEIQPSMLFMKDHNGKITEGPLISLANEFAALGDQCDWMEVKLLK